MNPNLWILMTVFLPLRIRWFRYLHNHSIHLTMGSAQSALQSPSWERFLRGKRFWNVVCDERAYSIIHRIGQSATKRPEFYHLTVKYETCLFILDKTHLFLVIQYFNRDLSGTVYFIPSFCHQFFCYFNLLLWQILP